MSLVAFLTALSNYSVQPFLPVMADDLGTTVPVVGQAATVPLFVAAMVGLAAGPLADFTGFKPVIIGGLLLIAASAIGAGLATTFEVLLAARLLAGLGAAATAGTLFAFVGAAHDHGSRQRALSFVAAAFSASAVVGVPLLTAIEQFAGWRGAMFAIAAATILTAAGLIRFLSDPNRGTSIAWPGVGAIVRAYSPLLRDARMITAFVGIIGIGMGTIGAVTYVGAYFTEAFGTSTGRIGLLLAAAGGAYTLGSIIGGTSIFDFRIRGLTLGLGLVSGIGIWSVFGLDSGPAFAVVAMVTALLIAGVMNLMFVTVLSYESRAGAATTMAMQASVTNLGSAIGVALGGLALGLQGYQALGLLTGLSFLTAGVVATASILLLSYQPRMAD